MYSSTCFGSPHAHHQELNNYSSSLWFYRWSVVVAVLLVVVGPAGRPDHDQQHHVPTVNQRRLLQLISSWLWAWVYPRTLWAVFKRQAINLRDWCIWLIDLFEYMMIHELTNPKSNSVLGLRECEEEDIAVHISAAGCLVKDRAPHRSRSET
jgi:hypothetical protein